MAFIPFPRQTPLQRTRSHITLVGRMAASEEITERDAAARAGNIEARLELGYISETEYQERRQRQEDRDRRDDEGEMREEERRREYQLQRLDDESKGIDVDAEENYAAWLDARNPKSKKGDIKEFEKILKKDKEKPYRQNAVDSMLDKYGRDSEVVSLLNRYGWEVVENDEANEDYNGRTDTDLSSIPVDQSSEERQSVEDVGENTNYDVIGENEDGNLLEVDDEEEDEDNGDLDEDDDGDDWKDEEDNDDDNFEGEEY